MLPMPRNRTRALAVETYSEVADSAYPVHAALAHLGLASVEVDRGEAPSHAAEAARLGRMIGTVLLVSLADGLAAGAGAEELFFP